MSSLETLGKRYVDVWNETDEEKRRKAIADLWVPDGVHFVKTMEARGYDELEKRVIGSHVKNVKERGNCFRAVNDLQILGNAVKFTWEMVPQGGDKVLAVGLEFLIVDDNGKVLTDYQFIIA
jgi:hypothetical protein